MHYVAFTTLFLQQNILHIRIRIQLTKGKKKMYVVFICNETYAV